MKKLLLILLPLSLFGADDDWNNKTQHAVFFGATSAIIANIGYDYGLTKSEAWWLGVGISSLIGIGKELHDTNFGWEDFAANTFGSVVGASSLHVIYRW
jgi:hypothetical protein